MTTTPRIAPGQVWLPLPDTPTYVRSIRIICRYPFVAPEDSRYVGETTWVVEHVGSLRLERVPERTLFARWEPPAYAHPQDREER